MCMFRDRLRPVALAAVSLVAGASLQPNAALADDLEVARGKYLVELGACGDCHTPGYLRGSPDLTRLLGGSDVGFEVPRLGIIVPPNLTPDVATGLGNWTRGEIVTAIQTGVTPDGRILAPIMPWRALANLTKDDAMAIATYLKSLPPVPHQVPGPFGPNDRPPISVMKVVPPQSADAAE